jgi:hypothetical protein
MVGLIGGCSVGQLELAMRDLGGASGGSIGVARRAGVVRQYGDAIGRERDARQAPEGMYVLLVVDRDPAAGPPRRDAVGGRRGRRGEVCVAVRE